MTVLEHDYGIPDEDELAQLVGAATPHFAFQVRDRVAAYAERLPEDHPRRAELADHIERLHRLGMRGESAGARDLDLPPRVSLQP